MKDSGKTMQCMAQGACAMVLAVLMCFPGSQTVIFHDEIMLLFCVVFMVMTRSFLTGTTLFPFKCCSVTQLLSYIGIVLRFLVLTSYCYCMCSGDFQHGEKSGLGRAIMSDHTVISGK